MRAAPEVAELAEVRRLLSALDPSGPPRATQVCGPRLDPARVVVAVSGSFNPPHLAHLALLRAGVAASNAGAGLFVLSVRTVDKERLSGMLLEDRLWLLCGLLHELGRDLEEAPHQGPVPALGAVATSHGLYVEQAAALRRLCPDASRLVFVVGFDKIVQIFDPRYYADRDADLDRLFSQAEFLVAPRAGPAPGDLSMLLARPENRRYAGAVRPLAIDPSLAAVSSTAARQAIARGAPLDDLLPERVIRFVAATGCYLAPDGEGPYAARAAALNAISC